VGRRAARDVPRGRHLSPRLAALATALLLVAGCSGGDDEPRRSALEPLDVAISALNSERGRLLASIDDVQRAATALDDTDALCVTGAGGRARKAYRVAEPLAAKAQSSARALPARIRAYRTALAALRKQAPLLAGRTEARLALTRVLEDGDREAAAVERLRRSVVALWPAYSRLAGDQDTWTSRSVSGWYRSDREGAAAYTVLVDGYRGRLNAARRTLESAVTDFAAPTRAQRRSLAAANRALADLR
jgi:hypothetical protein